MLRFKINREIILDENADSIAGVISCPGDTQENMKLAHSLMNECRYAQDLFLKLTASLETGVVSLETILSLATLYIIKVHESKNDGKIKSILDDLINTLPPGLKEKYKDLFR